MASHDDILDEPMRELGVAATSGTFDDIVACAKKVHDMYRDTFADFVMKDEHFHIRWAIRIADRYNRYVERTEWVKKLRGGGGLGRDSDAIRKLKPEDVKDTVDLYFDYKKLCCTSKKK